eukprot:gene14239-19107_t
MQSMMQFKGHKISNFSQYPLFAHVDSLIDDRFIRQIHRPFKQDAVHWTVNVKTVDQLNFYVKRQGIILDYKSDVDEEDGSILQDFYLVEYDDNHERIWEAESSNKMGRYSSKTLNMSISRFDFITKRVDSKHDIDNKNSYNAKIINRIMELYCNDSISDQKISNNWKEEYLLYNKLIPSKLVENRQNHSDEVLFIKFSNTGKYLACCSRDCTFYVFKLNSAFNSKNSNSKLLTNLILHTLLKDIVRVEWSPSDQFLVVTVDFGNEFSGDIMIFELIEDCNGKLQLLPKIRLLSNPYDFHFVWIDDYRAIFSRTINWFVGGSCEQHLSVLQYQHTSSFEIHPSVTMFLKNEKRVFRSGQTIKLNPQTPQFCDGTLLVCSAGEDTHANIICVFSLTEEIINSTEWIDMNIHPHIDVNGCIIGLDVCDQKYGCSQYIIANVRPALEDNAYHHKNPSTEFQVPHLSQEAEMRLYDPINLNLIYTFKGHYCFSLPISPFSSYTDHVWCNYNYNNTEEGSTTGDLLLASGSETGDLYIWSLTHKNDGLPIKIIRAHSSTINAVSFHPTKSGMLASASDDCSI